MECREKANEAFVIKSQPPVQCEQMWQEQHYCALAEQMQQLEYEGGTVHAAKALPPSPPPEAATPPPPPATPAATATSSPPEPPPQRGRRPRVPRATLQDPSAAVHECRFLRSSGTTWIEQVTRLATAETVRRHAQEQRRRQLSSWTAEVSRGIAESQQRQRALLEDVQRERERRWAETGRRIGAERLQSPVAAEEPQDEESVPESVPETAVSSRRRPAPTFEPAWDWAEYCWDWQDE